MMSEQDYRDASFLDDRLFQQWRDVRTLPLPIVKQAMPAEAPRPASWVSTQANMVAFTDRDC